MLDNNPSTGARLLVILTTETEMRTDHSDDNEPITDEWLAAQNFPARIPVNDRGGALVVHVDGAELSNPYGDAVEIDGIKTRGKLRRLISALNGD